MLGAVGALAGGVIAGRAFGPGAAPSPAGRPEEVVADPGTVGTDGCRSCHAHEAETWSRSPHARHAVPRAEPEGGADVSVGSVWMQAYLRRDPQDYLRILPHCWDLRTSRWRDVVDVLEVIRGRTKGGPTPPPPVTEGRSFDTDCAGCHAVGTTMHLDTETGKVQTHWRDLAIDCEACHGPGRDHATGHGDTPIVRLQDLSLRARTAVCGRCHGGPPTAGTFGPDDAVDYVPQLLDRLGIYPDGTPGGQLYQVGSFVRSPCYREGGLTCTDCHDAHGPGLVVEGSTDALCQACHLEQQTVEHTHHDPLGPGGACIDCHMPRLLGGILEHQRDHRISIPRPELEDVPDACSTCHADRDRAWVVEARTRWWGPSDQATLDAVRAIAAARRGSGADLAPALAHPDPWYRAVAAQRLADGVTGIEDPAPEVRLAAVRAAIQAGAITEALRARRRDPEPRIRGEVAAALYERGEPLSPAEVEDVRRLTRQDRVHEAARRVLADVAVVTGHPDEAVRWLEELLAVEPGDGRLWLRVAEVEDARGGRTACQRAVEHAVSAYAAAWQRGQAPAMALEAVAGRYIESGRRALAAQILGLAAEHFPDPEARRRYQEMAERYLATFVRRGS